MQRRNSHNGWNSVESFSHWMAQWDRPQENIKHQNNSKRQKQSNYFGIARFSLFSSLHVAFDINEIWQEMEITFNIVTIVAEKLWFSIVPAPSPLTASLFMASKYGNCSNFGIVLIFYAVIYICCLTICGSNRQNYLIGSWKSNERLRPLFSMAWHLLSFNILLYIICFKAFFGRFLCSPMVF